jgi:hypothetical protein
MILLMSSHENIGFNIYQLHGRAGSVIALAPHNGMCPIIEKFLPEV